MIANFETISEARWQEFARYISQPAVAQCVIERAALTPYTDLPGYMNRTWLFNPTHECDGVEEREFPELASVRIHHILRADYDRHRHNHPFDARIIILKGWYEEEREDGHHLRQPGDTAALGADVFHKITMVSEGGVWTMFFMGAYVQPWGFKTESGFVPSRQYLGIPEEVDG